VTFRELEKRYRSLLSRIDQRKEGVDKLVDFLENETNWLEAPASTRFHMSEKHGLLYHSIGVAETLIRLAGHLDPVYTDESLIITGLFHDVGKVGFEGTPYYLDNPSTGNRHLTGTRSFYKPYIVNNDIVAMSHAIRSLYHVQRFVELSPEEAQAITYHDGPYTDGYKEVAMKEEPLTLLLHFSDLWHATQLE